MSTTESVMSVGEKRYLAVITAAILKRLRKLGGLTQEGLASDLGFTQARVSQLETAVDLATLDVIVRSATSVGAKLNLLVEHPLLGEPLSVPLQPVDPRRNLAIGKVSEPKSSSGKASRRKSKTSARRSVLATLNCT